MDKTNKLLMMNRNLILILGIVLFSLTLVSAEVQSLEDSVKQNQCVTLLQKYYNSTFSNVTTITYPNSTAQTVNLAMNGSNGSWSYSFCNTSQIGSYEYCTLTDVDGVNTYVCIDFEVTPSGFVDTLSFYYILIIFVVLVTGLGFKIQEPWFVVIGGMFLMMLGIYSINSGIAGFRDMFMTWAIGLFEIGIGFTLTMGAAYEKMENA